MANHPVICDSVSMMLVAIVGNLNPTIEKKSTQTLSSGQLYDFKRDLLWVLYDQDCMNSFPFGLMELGDCEEHRGSKRSDEWVTIPEIPEPILMNEKLFWDAIQVNKRLYQESQTYPYFCTYTSCRWWTSSVCILASKCEFLINPQLSLLFQMLVIITRTQET
jgi:hypothetical protein